MCYRCLWSETAACLANVEVGGKGRQAETVRLNMLPDFTRLMRSARQGQICCIRCRTPVLLDLAGVFLGVQTIWFIHFLTAVFVSVMLCKRQSLLSDLLCVWEHTLTNTSVCWDNMESLFVSSGVFLVCCSVPVNLFFRLLFLSVLAVLVCWLVVLCGVGAGIAVVCSWGRKGEYIRPEKHNRIAIGYITFWTTQLPEETDTRK